MARVYTLDDLNLIELRMAEQARESFWAFRQYINPKMKKGWWQREIAAELQKFYNAFIAGERPKLVIEAPPQHGKLLDDETPVMTTKGWKKHGELVVGDYVYHPSGKPVKVKWLSEKAPARMRVELTNGDVFWCHERHEWTVYNRNKKKFETIETQEMLKSGKRSKQRNPLFSGEQGRRGCHYVYQLPLVSPIVCQKKELPLDPYTLGAWLGDGTQTKPTLTHDVNDQAIIDRIEANGIRATRKDIHKKTGVVSTSFGSVLIGGLREAGVYADSYGVRKKHIPDVYLTASLDDRLNLLAGLIDTDGYTYHRNGRTVFTTSDTRLADTFCELISTFGWSFSRVIEKPKLSSSGIQGKKDYFVIGFNPSLKIPCALTRKQNGRLITKSRRVAIKSITCHADSEKIGNCITVDSPDGLYLVGKTMQPTHNSYQIIDFIAWLAGKDPDKRTIYTSFSERLGIRANLRLQRIYDSAKYKRVFPDTKINDSGNVTSSGSNLRNREMLEYVGHEGYFRNTTVRGSITGEGLDLGVVDDPLKGREAANSEAIRDATWDWFTDDFFSRFSDEAALLFILTRWHIDDPVGRLLLSMPEVKVLKYRAIATQDEPNRKEGEALFPEHKSKEFLLERKALMFPANWEALYQQNPQIVGGEIIKSASFGRYKVLPHLKYRKIYGDTAQKTAERNDYSVFECWGSGAEGKIYLIDMIRGKWEAPELKQKAIDFWNKHKALDNQKGVGGVLRSMEIEDKASGTGLVQEIRRGGKIPVHGIERNKDKYTRATDCVGYIDSGYVMIPEDAPWVSDFCSECDAFTADDSHLHDDQIDPMLDAIIDMLGGTNTLKVWENLI